MHLPTILAARAFLGKPVSREGQRPPHRADSSAGMARSIISAFACGGQPAATLMLNRFGRLGQEQALVRSCEVYPPALQLEADRLMRAEARNNTPYIRTSLAVGEQREKSQPPTDTPRRCPPQTTATGTLTRRDIGGCREELEHFNSDLAGAVSVLRCCGFGPERAGPNDGSAPKYQVRSQNAVIRRYAWSLSDFNHKEHKGHGELTRYPFNPVFEDQHPEVDEQAQTKPSCCVSPARHNPQKTARPSVTFRSSRNANSADRLPRASCSKIRPALCTRYSSRSQYDVNRRKRRQRRARSQPHVTASQGTPPATRRL